MHITKNIQLQAVDLVKAYKKRTVVDGVNITVKNKTVIGLLGPNGAGKTTSFYSIAGFIKPDSGKIIFNNKDITNMPIHQRALRGISYLSQEASIFKNLTVEENIRIILEPLGLPENTIKNRINTLLAGFKTEHLRQNKGHALSGGERRRVEIMRCLSTKPKFILLDEPFAGVDPIAVSELQQIIKALRNSEIGVLISDHNVRETLGICDMAYIMNNGKILTHGTPDEIINNPDVRKMYLGDNFTM